MVGRIVAASISRLKIVCSSRKFRSSSLLQLVHSNTPNTPSSTQSLPIARITVHLDRATGLQWDLGAQSGWWLGPVVAKHIALRILGNENQELVVLEWKTELSGVVSGECFISGSAGAVEVLARVNAGGGWVAVILARNWVAGWAIWCSRSERGGRQEKEGTESLEDMHRARVLFEGTISI
ncbi:hypothetical protein PRK78_005519 [Emydomyces testavorans]|uniref:Uncharacterized protein n=1 Tax=Emydomyces testavorans TaxID=2070801 RepID=A0AAF0DNK8_9EURO|nr:hypothetical protein PRK78_005519 [Emydomyces testavorans]